MAGLLLAVTVTVGACTDGSGSASGGSATGLGEKASTAAGGSARPAPGAAPPAKSSLTSAQLGGTAKIRTATMTVAVTGAENVAKQADRADTLLTFIRLETS